MSPAVRRAPLFLLLLKAALCWLVVLRTEVPGRDGVSYLWMAERSALGDPSALWSTVFHPGYPALIRMLLRVWPTLDPETAGQLVACGCAVLAMLPLWAVTRACFGERAAWWTGLAYALGAWFARHPAECLSEGPFFLLVATWAWCLLRERPLAALAGTVAALAYLTRPEGAALGLCGMVWLWRRHDRDHALELLLGALPFAALLPLGYAALGTGFTLTPKAAFNWDVGAGDPEGGGFGHVLAEVLALPGAAFEELGWVVLPLVLLGLWWRRGAGGGLPWLLLLPFLLQCLAVPLLRTHYRFLAGFGVLLLPFAGVAAAGLWDRLARRGRWWPWLLPVVLVAAEARVVRPQNAGRAIERELGRHLGSLLRPGEQVLSDMPRLVWFAGRRPPPPRPIAPSEILAAAAAPRARFVAVVEGRTGLDPEDLLRLGLEPMELPALLSASAGRRGVRVYAKNPRR